MTVKRYAEVYGREVWTFSVNRLGDHVLVSVEVCCDDQSAGALADEKNSTFRLQEKEGTDES